MVRSRPEIRNAVRELTKMMQEPTLRAEEAMYRVMRYCAETPNRGLVLKPDCYWNGKDRKFKFVVRGRADSEYAKDPLTRRSIGGITTFLCGASVMERSKGQKMVALSVTEAEYIEAVHCAQEMVSHKNLLESMGLEVELPMILEMDNIGAIDLSNNWSMGGRTKHIDVRFHWLRELKLQGILQIVWISSDDNTADIHTKNLSGPAFERHGMVYFGEDEYIGRVDPEGETSSRFGINERAEPSRSYRLSGEQERRRMINGRFMMN